MKYTPKQLSDIVYKEYPWDFIVPINLDSILEYYGIVLEPIDQQIYSGLKFDNNHNPIGISTYLSSTESRYIKAKVLGWKMIQIYMPQCVEPFCYTNPELSDYLCEFAEWVIAPKIALVALHDKLKLSYRDICLRLDIKPNTLNRQLNRCGFFI